MAFKICLKQLRDLINEGEVSPTIRPACEIKEYMSNFSKKETLNIIFLVIYFPKLKIRFIGF